MLLTTGAEANEAALRMAKLVTGRHEVVSFARSWHGMTQARRECHLLRRSGAVTALPLPATSPCRCPTAFRPAIVDAAGNLDWRRQLDLGFDLIDAQSAGASPPASSSRS